MKGKKCAQCNNTTYQKDGICVSCKLGLTKMYDELKEMMERDKKWSIGLKPNKS